MAYTAITPPLSAEQKSTNKMIRRKKGERKKGERKKLVGGIRQCVRQ
jgi:hypothetical protein